MHPYLPPGTKRQIWAWFFRCTSWHTGYPWVKTLAFRGLIYTSGALCVSRVQKKKKTYWIACKAAVVDTATEVKSLMDVYGSNESQSCLWPCILALPSMGGKAGSSAILWPQSAISLPGADARGGVSVLQSPGTCPNPELTSQPSGPSQGSP